MLDNLEATHVNWTPYGESYEILPISYYNGCIHFLEVNEPYMPIRVSRQFGRVQEIPRPPIRSTICKLCSAPKSYKKEYGCNDSHWQDWDTHRYDANWLGAKVSYAEEATDDYLPWFRRHSHVRVSNPVHDVGI
ncbi:hypothetical protein LIER_11318 [Lithospermum erythrorhizon]|uniref:Aminotransferase-like plant mobile domain-containing protein n=1 Tax=Lithospermum erythrorhizon TaxID=34254 RepID=A0AAV3PPD1_LITER